MRQPEVVKLLGKAWGAGVVAERTKFGLSQAELARRCKVTQQTISKIEGGAMLPNDDLKVLISLQLGTSPDRLFAWPTHVALVEAVA